MDGKCECVTCDECGGTGTVWFALGGKYLGKHRCDDMDTMEPCEECTNGVTEVCDYCRDEMERERKAEEEYDAAQEDLGSKAPFNLNG